MKNLLRYLHNLKIDSIDDIYEHYGETLCSNEDFRITESIYKQLNNELSNKDVSFSRNREPTIFLSHGHKDLIYAYCIALFLKKTYEVNVYIDAFDFSMPSTTSAKTAQKLRDKIRSCSRFIFVGTKESFNSKWCNWELGIGDYKSTLGHLAFFVMSDRNEKNGGYDKNEYVGLYPFIFDQRFHPINRINDTLYVGYFGADSASFISMKEWLHNKKSPSFSKTNIPIIKQINRNKTFIAFYFAKFKANAKEALGYRTYSEAFSDIAFRLGGTNDTYLLWRRHEFNKLLKNIQYGLNTPRLPRKILIYYGEWNNKPFETFTQEILRMIGK